MFLFYFWFLRETDMCETQVTVDASVFFIWVKETVHGVVMVGYWLKQAAQLVTYSTVPNVEAPTPA